MTRRRAIQMFLLLALGHIAGSYAVEGVDRLINADVYIVTGKQYVLETAAAPVRILPMLIKDSVDPAIRDSNQATITIWWIAYLTPVSAAIALHACSRKKIPGHGFPPKVAGQGSSSATTPQ